MTRSLLLAAAGSIAIGMTALAGEKETPTLKLGDAAPSIDIAHWIKGDTVSGFEKGKVYVVEFWATWCGPCRESMPHLSSLQRRFKDYGVTVIGVSDEPLETVQGFLGKENKKSGKPWDESVEYTLATDPDKSVLKDYKEAAGRQGIPWAFIIGKDGAVEWIDHPMSMDWALESIVKDTWNRGNAKEIVSLRDQLDSMDINTQSEKVLNLLDQIAAIEPRALSTWDKFQKFCILLTPLNRPEKAYPLAEEMMKDNWNDATMLNMIAWYIVDQPGVKARDFMVASKAATRASELTGGTDAAILDTLARVHFESGNVQKAIDLQKQAVALAEGNLKAELEKVLKAYEAGKSPREMPAE
jgi:thiol-disulfide isomerase/thioredoxin